ncbi:ABC transporter ATP-binding protein [Candidatus Bathyarchaeota archaeon]|nr:ABC transporter ATP-binding protein [Candidatus Bathyarchaeota archaeon]MBS7613522.1 ABC transporter ATP-binding protein [Candidatus Bathyarchaeota archaeon]MBS7617566.1 ABC transporter ATP-binding protein [Candidatus Bathyarchaeota archaeon]
MPEVKLVDVTKRFGDVHALRGVSLTVKDGEYVCILGPSGCGKSTLLRIIAGLLQPDSGSIYIDGRDVTYKPPEERQVGFVFQNIALFPHMDSWSNVTYGPVVKCMDRDTAYKAVRELMVILNIAKYSGLYPYELSGGIAQMIAIVRALATGAKLLLLDEPLGALDPRVRVNLKYELRRMVKDLNLTAIHVTHNQEEALTVADRIVVMRSGIVEGFDTPENLYWRPKNLFIADFIGKVNIMRGVISRVIGEKVLISLTNGQLVELHAEGFSEGDSVVLAIRPENFEFSSDDVMQDISLTGVVARVRFMGEYYRYDVRTEAGETIIVNYPVGGDVKKLGEKVRIWFNPETVLIYPYPEKGIEKELMVEI